MEEFVWNNSNCLRLINEYKGQQMLWNPEHKHYYVRDKRAEAWSVMATNMGLEVEDLKYKINNLLGGFRREKNKISTIHDLNGPKKIYKSRWFAFKPMSFLLKDFVTTDIQDESEKETFQQHEEEDILLVPMEAPTQNSDSETSEQQNAITSIKLDGDKRKVRPVMRERLTRTKHKRRIMLPATSAASRSEDSRIIDALRALHKPEKKRDECDIFGEYIANALRKHDQRTRAMIKHAMNNILFESEMKKYNVTTNYQHVQINLTDDTNPLIIPDQGGDPMPMEESIISESHEDLDGQKLETIDNSYGS